MMIFVVSIARKLTFANSIKTNNLSSNKINSKLKFANSISTILTFKVKI